MQRKSEREKEGKIDNSAPFVDHIILYSIKQTNWQKILLRFLGVQ